MTTKMKINYTNWRGLNSDRHIIPLFLYFAANKFHPEKQWLLKAWDIDKRAIRSFAVKDIKAPRCEITFGASKSSEALRSVAYSMDLLIPGLYFWVGGFVLRLGGDTPNDTPYRYPGTIHSFTGLAVVLPNYRILSTYRSTHDPRHGL